MPSNDAFAHDNAAISRAAISRAAISWCEKRPGRGDPSAFWKTASARTVLACVSDQRRRRRACAMSDQAIHAWAMSLVRQTWPDDSERGRIAADLAPAVPSWWLGPGEADRLIVNALLKRSMRVRRAPERRRIGATPVACFAWLARPAGIAGPCTAIAN